MTDSWKTFLVREIILSYYWQAFRDPALAHIPGNPIMLNNRIFNQYNDTGKSTTTMVNG